ncbi:MAG: hypothetical protein HOE90_12935 [Bacteriovoracaceae bacterium]|nr:hypothetical protein [Bacteriovoracaceae bacterium]
MTRIFPILFLLYLFAGPAILFSQTAEDEDQADIEKLQNQMKNTAEIMEQLKGQVETDEDGNPIVKKGAAGSGDSLAHLDKMDPKQLKETFLSKIPNPKAQKFLKEHPAFLNFLVKFLKNKPARDGFISIPSKKKQLKIFGGASLAIFIIGFIWNANVPNDAGIFRKIFRKLVISGFTTVSIFCSFGYIFRVELMPTFNMIRSSVGF